jgi:hypothetical protein
MPYLYRILLAQKGTALRLAIAVFFMVIQKGTVGLYVSNPFDPKQAPLESAWFQALEPSK